MEKPTAKITKFEDVKKKATEMFQKGEIGAIRIIDIEDYRENNYCAIYFFPDIKKEYGNEKIFKEGLYEFTIYSFPGIEFELLKECLHFINRSYTVLIVIYYI